MGNLGNGVSISGKLDDPELKRVPRSIRISKEAFDLWTKSSGRILYAATDHYSRQHEVKLEFWAYISGYYEVTLGHKQLYFGTVFSEAQDTFNMNAK